jgi:hypothetical protein
MRPARSEHPQPAARGHRLRTTAACLALSVNLLGAGCGSSGRSVAAVCHVWATEGLALHERYENVDKGERTKGAEGMLAGLVSIFAAPNELSGLMTRMAAVAPSSVEPDFEAVASSFKKLSDSESDALTDPLGALGGNLVDALAVSGSYSRVDAFLSTNCGIPGR